MEFGDLRGILQYVPQFRDKLFVINVDGSVVGSDNFSNVVLDLAVLYSLGVRFIIVHGADQQIKDLYAEKYGDELLVHSDEPTDPDLLEISIDAVSRVTNLIMKELTAVGLKVASADVIIARSCGVISGVDCLLDGVVEKVDKDSLSAFLESGMVPILTPICFNESGAGLVMDVDSLVFKVGECLGANKIIMPPLDVFQTVPTFAYLLPILLLFGFGTVLGLIASVVYSFPPMVRNTILGLERVSDEIIESGIMAGATPRQLFWQVRVPASRRQLMLGVNQTTMASFSMVIIASIIGGTADIGWTVLYYIRKAEVGESLLVGIVIALMAIIIDRITASFASRQDQVKPKTVNFLIKGQYGFIILFCALVLWIAATYFNFLDATNVKYGAGVVNYIDKSFEDFVKEYRSAIKVLKTYALFYIMLPVKIGLQEAVSPYTWGFSLTSIHLFLYFGSMIGISILLLVLGNKKLSISLILFMIFFYFGLTKMPWIGLILIYSLGCWQVGGIKLGLGAALGLCFIVVCGVWSEAMISAYLCGIAVIISFLVGSVLGVWAAHNNIISSVIRPINDTLQTMPLFVILIPFVMLFKIGDFTALLAIIAYAIVPAIRYAEHGIRNLPETVIESARMMGATKRQLFWQVELPLALPVIMIGLNQTIMYGIAMLVITALVGTNGLEQIVYIGLNDGNFGVGMVAGISMAIIAIITDRATKAWSVARGRQLGIKSL